MCSSDLRAKVGDRYIMEMLTGNGWLLGGESSGHIICLDITSTGDGIIAALQVLEAMLMAGQPLASLVGGMQRFPQHMVNVRLAERVDISASPSVLAAVAATEARLKGEGRVLLRPSGTEPVIRVMVEGRQATEVEALACELAAVVSRSLAAGG